MTDKMEQLLVDLQSRIETLEKRVESGRGGIEVSGGDTSITRESFSEEFFGGDVINIFVDNFWYGAEALGKFGEGLWAATLDGLSKFGTGLWYGTEGLSKFGIELFTASASGREKFGAGWLVDSLVGVSGIAAAKILVGVSVWLHSLIFGYGTSNPTLNTNKLSIPPYKLPTTAYNYIINGSFEQGDWGGSETQFYSASGHPNGRYCARLIASGSNIKSGYSNFIDIRGYEKVTLSAYTYITPFTTGDFFLLVDFYKADKTPCSPTHADIYKETSAHASWIQRSKIFTIESAFPSDCAYIRVHFSWWNASGNPSGTAYVDCFQVNFGDQIPVFQDFTAYSYNWMPQKIETTASTTYSWSGTGWVDVLSLAFDCESAMLLFIFAHARVETPDGTKTIILRVILDDVEIDDMRGYIGSLDSTYYTYHQYMSHSVKIETRGSHTLKLQIACGFTGQTVYAIQRRLSIIKGFYQGGTT